MKMPDFLIYSVFQRQDDRIRNNITDRAIQISTGKKYKNISDNPSATYNVNQLKQEISQLSQFSRNRLFADINLTYVDYALGKMSDRVKALYTKTIQAKKDIVKPEQREAMAAEFREGIDFLLDMANEKLGENYVFSGTALTTKPFDTNYAYRGGKESFKVQIGTDNKVDVFKSGERVFTTNVYELDTTFNSPTDTFTLGGDGQATLNLTYKGTTYSITYDNNAADPTNPSNLQELVDAINNATGERIRAFAHQLEDGTYTLRLIPEDTLEPINISFSNVGDPSEQLGNFTQKSVFEIVDRVYRKLGEGMSPDDSDVMAMQRSYDKIVYERSDTGSLLSSVKQTQETMEFKDQELRREKSEVEDADVSESIYEYTKYRTAYEALMRIVADTKDLTILRYL